MFVQYPKTNSMKNALHGLDTSRKVMALGTVKVHGTNGGITKAGDELFAQSRNRVLGPGKEDNAAFYQKVMSHKDKLLASLENGMTVYGEWCGANIQSGVSISGMEKAFIIFAIKEDDVMYPAYELPELLERLTEIEGFYSSTDFLNFMVEGVIADEAFLSQIKNATLMVEENCPVGAALNPNSECTIGEGIVWRVYDESNGDYLTTFKSKGVKHQGNSKSKVNVGNGFSEQQVTVLNAFTRMALDNGRLCQGMDYLHEMNKDTTDMKNLGEYLKWISQDIRLEHYLEIEELAVHELEWKHAVKIITRSAKDFYVSMANK